MGGAVFTSLDGEAHFAALPERVETALRGAVDRLSGARKADKLPPVGENTAARQVVRLSMTSRVGSREMVRVRPFVRVSSNLSLSTTELSANIPAFNPQKLLSEGSGEGAADEPAARAEPDAEVSFVMRELTPMVTRMKIASVMPLDDILVSVREAANWTNRNTGKPFAVATTQPGQLAYAPADSTPDPYRGFETRIIPENITLLPKTASQTTGGNSWSERAINVRRGDNITTILRELGATPDEIKAIASILGARGRDNGLKEGQRLRILLSQIVGGVRQQPIRVIIANDSAIEAAVALSDGGKYVAVDVASINTEIASASEDDGDDDGSGVRLYKSIYETSLRNNIPRTVIDELIRIYSYDVDFQRKVQAGDSFDVLYAGEEETPGVDGKNDVLFASLTVGGEVKKFYRFQTTDDNVVDYYDETGKSAKKFLVRKPVNEAIMRSGFGVRRHPILGYMKMHTGVDWSADHGSPIFSAGNGVVERVGWEGGYGKYVRLKHNNGYETAYGHMSAYAKGMEPGKRVRQGQVIGFVGSTGMSTGAHVHYEILVNGRFVDPMRIKLPRGRSLEGGLMAGFEKERDRLDGMMSNRGGAARVSDAGNTGSVRQVSNR